MNGITHMNSEVICKVEKTPTCVTFCFGTDTTSIILSHLLGSPEEEVENPCVRSSLLFRAKRKRDSLQRIQHDKMSPENFTNILLFSFLESLSLT